MTNNSQGILLRNLVKDLEGGPYYTTTEVAQMLGKHTDTIIRWRRRQDAPQPSAVYRVGKLDTNLYTEDDVAALKEWAKDLKPGWPKGRSRKKAPDDT